MNWEWLSSFGGRSMACPVGVQLSAECSDLRGGFGSIRVFSAGGCSASCPLGNSPKFTSGCFHALKSQPEASARDFAHQLDPSLTLFEVARFGVEVVHLRRNTGIYHNPKRQRGISGNPA
jgi:hypothetical protein